MGSRSREHKCRISHERDFLLSDRIRWLSEAEIRKPERSHAMASTLVTGTEAASGGGLCGAVGSLKKILLGKWPQGCSMSCRS